MKPSKKVCIIGAGPSGLCAAKEFLAAGFQVIGYDKRPEIGGIWNLSGSSPGVSLRTHASSSKDYLQFSDYPMPFEAPFFPHYSDYLKYLKNYGHHFKVIQYFQLNSEVTKINQVDTRWIIQVKNKEGKIKTEDFDAVAICSGLHETPNNLQIRGIEFVEEKIIHSSLVKEPKQFEGKKILIIGGGESAADLSYEVSEFSKETALSLRRGVAVLRKLKGINKMTPADYDASRAVYWLSLEFKHDLFHPEQNPPFLRWMHLFFLPVYSLLLLLRRLKKFRLSSLFSISYFNSLFNPSVRHGPASGLELSKACENLISLTKNRGKSKKETLECLLKTFEWFSGGVHSSQPFTKSDKFLENILEEKIRVLPGIKEVSSDGEFIFENGIIDSYDVIINCTGFLTKVPFLNSSFFETKQIYKHTFPIDTEGLVFIGFTRPNIGAMPPIAEMQARWVAKVWSKRKILPTQNQMKVLAQREGAYLWEYKEQEKRVLIPFVNYHEYMSDLAKILGCHPRIWKLLFNPPLLKKLLFGPFAAYQFRIHGPNKNRPAALQSASQIKLGDYMGLEEYYKQSYFYFIIKPCFLFLSKLIGSQKFKPIY